MSFFFFLTFFFCITDFGMHTWHDFLNGLEKGRCQIAAIRSLKRATSQPARLRAEGRSLRSEIRKLHSDEARITQVDQIQTNYPSIPYCKQESIILLCTIWNYHIYRWNPNRESTITSEELRPSIFVQSRSKLEHSNSENIN